MKPPVTIDSLISEWATDAKYNETEPSKEMAKISLLHAKYLRILTHHNLMVKKQNAEYIKLKKLKWEYYSGDLNGTEELEALGWEPIRKILKPDMPMHLDSDADLNNILVKKIVHQEIVDICTSILKEINNRTYQLSNIIKWEIFKQGA
jgi:hypothetical protein